MTLSDTQKRHLRGLAHNTKPIVAVGQQGLRDSVFAEIDQALLAHELIKVRVGAENRESRADLIDAIASRCDAVIIRQIGHVAVLFRRNPKQPKIALPSR